MRKLLRYMKHFRKECILAPLFKMLEATFELLIPLVVARIVDVGITNRDQGYVANMCLVMVLLGVIGLVCSITAQYFAARAAVGFAARVRHGVMWHLLGLSYEELDAVGTSTMVTRMTSDVNQVQTGVNLTLRLLLRSPFVVFGAMIMAFTIDVRAASVFAGVIPLLCVVVFGVMLITMPMYRRVQGRLDGVTSATRQNLAGVRVLRAFGKENAEIENFQKQTDALSRGQLKAGSVSGLMNPVTYVIINVAVVLLIQTGALQVESGVLTQGQVVALYNYMSQILVELIKMANLIISMTRAAACGKRIQSILDIRSSQTDGSRDLRQVRGQVEFKNVKAQYPGTGESALEDISFLAAPGQTVGIIGGTGSGKTTLVNLITRFYDAASGQVLIDGVDVTDLRIDTLRRHIGVVPQKPVLFRGTVRQNLQWGKADATEEELMASLRTAQAEDVILSKEGGLDAQVEQGGTNFSGGQRQRLTIARALVRQPKILILDDSASALDYGTDARLRLAIKNMKNPPTTFIVSQRAASVRYADWILVLEDGRLVGQGQHDGLLRTCPVYQEIYYSQFPRGGGEHEE